MPRGFSLIVNCLTELRLFPIRRQQSIGAPLLSTSACLLVVVLGCEKPETANWVKNGFLDPTQVGRFREPAVNSIRHSLSLLEEPMHLETAEAPTPADLIPAYDEPKIEPQDTIMVSILELLTPGEYFAERIKVSTDGAIALPVLGSLHVAGLSPSELESIIKQQLREKEIFDDTEVQVQAIETLGLRYSILGQVPRPGSYPITIPDYLLLNALANAGGVPPELHELFVIRQGAKMAVEQGTPAPTPVHKHEHHSSSAYQEPINLAAKPIVSHVASNALGQTEPLHLSDLSTPTTTQSGPARVIVIDVEQLMNGVPSQNIVIRPLDLIYASHGAMGEYFMSGNVARPGAYEIHGHGPTLKQAIATAGGLGPLAWPSRVQITRRINKDEEQTLQVDLDAIFAGTEGDVLLKPNDLVNVGTTAISPFLATIRNAIRFTYGFGFLYDRNFADSDSAQAREQVKQRRAQEARARGLPGR